jgi:hypothetical protein
MASALSPASAGCFSTKRLGRCRGFRHSPNRKHHDVRWLDEIQPWPDPELLSQLEVALAAARERARPVSFTM